MAAERTFSVYIHTSPSGKVYVGITKQKPTRRWQNGLAYKENPHFYAAIQKHGWDNFKHEIVADKLTQKEAESKEIELIAYYNSTDHSHGYNISTGGSVNIPSEEGRERLRKMWTGHVVPAEVRRKISESQKGKVIPPEVRAKMSASHKGKPKAPEAIRKANEAKYKAVLCVETGEVFRQMKEAQIKYKTRHIHSVCKGHRKTAAGLHWRYFTGGDCVGA